MTPDDLRVDELARRVGQVERSLNGLPSHVAELKTDLSWIKREISGPDGAISRLSSKVDELVGNPIAEARQSKATLRISIIAAVVGSAAVVALSLFFLGSAHP